MWCNIRLLDAENPYFMRVPEFVVMNTRTNVPTENYFFVGFFCYGYF